MIESGGLGRVRAVGLQLTGCKSRVNVLLLIAAQTAILIENVRFYDELERRVSLRNQDILEKNRNPEETLRKQKQVQETLVRLKKMALTGQLMAWDCPRNQQFH